MSHHMQVVTNAQNVTEGMRTALAVRIEIRPMCPLLCAGITGLVFCSEGAFVISLIELTVFMQLEGSRTPGSDIVVAAATVRGSRSFGMICSAQDLGWMEAGNGFAVKLPQGMQLGTVLGPEVPEVCSKRFQAAVSCRPACAVEGIPHCTESLPQTIQARMQGADLGAEKVDKLDVSQAAKKSGKKKGGKAVKDKDAASAFLALRLEDEEDQQLDAEETSTGSQNDGIPSAAAPKQNGSTTGQGAEQIEPAAMKPKLGKKKKEKVDVGDAFAALGLDDGGKAERRFSATNGDIASENANGHLAGTDTSQAQQEGTEDKSLPSNLNGGAIVSAN